MGETITVTTLGPLVLNQAVQNALTITSTGAILSSGAGIDGVDGSNLQAWTIVNDGTVSSSGGIGIDLLNGGTVDNGLTSGGAALISGARAGGVISASSTIGAGFGYGAGVYVSGAAGTVTNYGAMTGAPTASLSVAAGP